MKEIKIELQEVNNIDKVVIIDTYTKYELVDSYNKMTIKQYQELNKLNSEVYSIEKSLKIINILTGIPVEVLNDYSVASLREIYEHLNFLKEKIEFDFVKTIEINGKGLEFDKEFLKDFNFQENIIDNLHIIISKIYKPVKKVTRESGIKYYLRNAWKKSDRKFNIKTSDEYYNPEWIRNFFTMNYVFGVYKLFEYIKNNNIIDG